MFNLNNMHMNQKLNLRFSVIVMMILLAAFSRLIPHPPNVAPIGAMSLFGAAYFSKKQWAFIIPVVSMWLADLVLNNVVYAQYFPDFAWLYPGWYFTYGAFIIIVLAGLLLLKKVSFKNVLIASLVASVLFFLISNFGVWFSGTMYPKTAEGLWACYVAGLPVFINTLLGDLFYCGVMFGSFELVKARFPALRLRAQYQTQ